MEVRRSRSTKNTNIWDMQRPFTVPIVPIVINDRRQCIYSHVQIDYIMMHYGIQFLEKMKKIFFDFLYHLYIEMREWTM